jgi:glycosyltransferase involved in cell wall biosynthesis
VRILLFDWTEGGHHELYVRRFADLLSASADVYVAVSDGVALSVTDSGASILPLGPARRPTDLTRARGPQHREWGKTEVRLFEWVVQLVRPDVAVHLYADPVLRWLVKRPVLPIRTVLCLFFPRAHYPKAYGSALSASERARAAFQEHLVRRWRRRPDAHALLTLDEQAARRWARGRGAPAHWLPEPPVDAPSHWPPPACRAGCLLFGSLAARKGIDRLAAAVCTAPHGLRVTLAGASEPGFSRRLEEYVCSMRAAGADVAVLDRQLTPQEGADMLAHSRCAVLPYPRHNGMSRVLVEAAAARTPVVVESHGLVGHLVRSHGLGAAVDSADPVTLAKAIRRFTDHEREAKAHEDALRRFAERYAPRRFARAVWGALHVAPNADHGGRSMLSAAGAGRQL